MHYPLTFSFKILALAPQISVRDAQGQLRWYVKQKLLKLKESVTVFADEGQTQPLFHINADRVLDISARYHITDVAGRSLGAVQRHGMRSFWKAHYEILAGQAPVMTIREENPWIKVIDGLIGEIPVVGLFTGYLFQPAYIVTRQDGTLEPVMHFQHQLGMLGACKHHHVNPTPRMSRMTNGPLCRRIWF